MSDEIGRMFASAFAPWGISVPEYHLTSRSPGHIFQDGWLIQYSFGFDDKGEFLDYYATHRMTNDRHFRLHQYGARTALPALNGMFASSNDPAVASLLEIEHRENNRRMAEVLNKKGFVLFTMNMWMKAELPSRDEYVDEGGAAQTNGAGLES